MVSRILLDIIAPILLMIGVGALAQWKFRLDLATLSKLNIYVFVPAFVFDRVSGSNLPWQQMGGVAIICIVQCIMLLLMVLPVCKLMKFDRKVSAAVVMAVMFYNSGNYGLPLADLAYAEQGAAVQTFVLLTQNVLTFTIGLSIAAYAGTGDLARGILKILRMPVLPVLAAALFARWYAEGDQSRLPVLIAKTTGYLGDALVAFALLTLGAQLASKPRWPRWKPIGTVVVLRLVFGPIQMAVMLYLFHLAGWKATELWPWPAEMLIVTAATPTAVNTLLLTMECEGDVDLAADCVFWTTVTSCITIALWLLIVTTAFH